MDGELVDEGQLGGAGVAEAVPDPFVLEHLEQYLASRFHGPPG
jgi:hypothetical protein